MDASDLLTRLLSADREYRAAVKAVRENGMVALREARNRLGLSQRDLADRMGVNFTTISKIENGRMPMGRPFLARLARVVAGLPPVEDQPGRAATPGVGAETPPHGAGAGTLAPVLQE